MTNARKKQNTRRYTLKVKVSDVCWIGGGGESWTHVLLGYQKTFYILSLSIISYFDNAGKHALPTAESLIISIKHFPIL